jgi:glycosyltransferase involved in cell wall biosynthesis
VTQLSRSIESLIDTVPDAEIIVADNGESIADSLYLLHLTHQKKLASYTRYRENMHFYYARNDCLKRASRDYIAISDNDILFSPGWAEECIEFLEKNPGKFLATPIEPDPMNAVRKIRWAGEQGGWRLNYRAGSNIFVMRRADYEVIGDFLKSPIAGSKWVDTYVRLGYTMACMPDPKAFDMALREGYRLWDPIQNTTL